jgi:hypothetical protein
MVSPRGYITVSDSESNSLELVQLERECPVEDDSVSDSDL